MRRLLLASTLLLALTAAPAASASPSASPVDARVRALFDRRAQRGDTLPFYQRAPRFEAEGMAPLAIRWARLPTHQEVASYEALGFEVTQRLASGAFLVSAREEAVAKMEADGVLASVTVDLAPAIVARPLDGARSELVLGAVMAARRKAMGDELDGSGVILGDFDSQVDVYHPAFFRAGSPAIWLDADGDGVLTPGVDGFDWDGNGSLDETEILRLLDGRASRIFGEEDERRYGTEDLGYNPAWDYLYLDQITDGRRNVGPDVPGADGLAALGEPVFVADDVNGDGVITFPEKIVPLDGSKFLAIRDGNVFRRGENLAQYMPQGPFRDPSHATSMMGASAGGQPGYSRWLGMAPNAELVLSSYESIAGPSLTAGMQWLADEGADVINTELGYWGLVPSDGSTELELLMDALVMEGRILVSPAGNLGSSQKHANAVINGQNGAAYHNEVVAQSSPNYVAMSVTWREGNLGMTGSFSTSDGDVIDLGVDTPGGNLPSGRQYSVVSGTTIKGAGYLLLSLGGGPNLPASGNDLTLQNDGNVPANAALFIIDDVSTWGGGSGFADFDVEGCMNPPSLSVETISLGAYALHSGPDYAPYPEAHGQLRAFSGRGPDLWGNPGIDIASPDNPVTARAEAWPLGVPEGLYTSYTETGGTSGAGAITVGVAALYRQLHPELSGPALRDLILENARTDGDVTSGTPAQWGAGKLALPQMLAPGGPPSVSGVEPAAIPPDVASDITAAVTDDADLTDAKSRWDFDYDGIWDTDWVAGLSTSYVYPAGVASVVGKVEVMDADGWTAASLYTLTEGDPVVVPDDDDDPKTEEDGCGCRAAGAGERSHPWLLLLGAAAFLGRRRRPAVS